MRRLYVPSKKVILLATGGILAITCTIFSNIKTEGFAKDTKEIQVIEEVLPEPTKEFTEEIIKESASNTYWYAEEQRIKAEKEKKYWYAEEQKRKYKDVVKPEEKTTEVIVKSTESNTTTEELPTNNVSGVLTATGGVNWFGDQKETYYNLNMSGVINIMRNNGFSEEEYPYWVRDDGCKMLGPYIMIAANLTVHPRGSLVQTSLGTGLVCDTGGFASSNPYQVDIATTW